MKIIILMAICLAVGLSSSSFARVVLSETFDVNKDLLLLQYDSWPDSDDIHSQAAAGCMLRHSDWSDVNYYAVSGAYGVQVPGPTEDGYFIDSTSLFNLAFGTENVDWTDAHNHRNGSITRIKNKVIPVLNAGGRVWVAEAGQSDITADWISAVLAAGVDPTVVKNNVWVIHHSPWNQTLMTAPDNFDYVSANAYMYKRLGDGNADTLDNPNRVGTPGFVADETTYMNSALASPNLEARALWADTNAVLDAHYAANTDITNGNPHISIGGVDFSDTVVMWAILRDDDVETVPDFWAKYVMNTPTTGPTTGSGTYLESGGLIVMEAENTSSDLDQWLKKTSGLTNQPTGGSYLEFDGNTPISGPAMSPLTYTFKVNEAGLYFFNLYCARETVGDRTDIANDCWIRVEGDYTAGTGNNHAALEDLLVDTKFFGGEDKTLTWAAGARLDLGGEDNKVTAAYQFKEGETYTLVISGRSQLFKMDRIVFRRNTVNINDSRDLTLPESERTAGSAPKYVYNAISDFSDLTSGTIPYYEDAGRNALAIDAGNVSYRNKFARATTTFSGASGTYDVNITALGEIDGECSYRFLLNGNIIGTATNSLTSTDYAPQNHVFQSITIPNGATIAVESNNVSNGLIPEGAAFAFARGRWTALNFSPASTSGTTYRLTINGGNGSGQYPEGTVVNIAADAAPAGQVFDAWLTGATANVGDLSDPTTTFTTRATPSTVAATYKDAPVTTTYNLNINGGSGSGQYPEGTVVNIAADAAPAGQVFDAWLTGATANVGDLSDPTTTFTTRATASTVAATYKDAPVTTTYRLTINGGTGSGFYPEGTVVNITADAAPAGQVFDTWLTGATANVGNLTDPTTTFTTRATASTVAAIYKDAPVTTTYRLTINGGTGSGFYPEGTAVNITADAAPAGKVFDTWLTGATANVGDLTNPTTTFTTRATASTVAAIYKDAVPDLDTIIEANMYDAESHELDDMNVRDAGTKIASIRNGNWVAYNGFNFGTSGVASVEVSASTDNPSGGTIEFRLGSPTGTLISSVEVDEDVTGGGWNTFATFSNTISANVTGTHDLYLTFVGSGSGVLMHVRDFLFVSGSGDLGSNYYAESFNEESHPGDDTIIVRQGTNVAKIKNGSWIKFLDYNFSSGASNIEVSAANDNLTADADIEFRLGSPTGTLIGTVVVSDTGAWNSFATFSTNQVTSVPGVHDLYLVFTGNGNVIMKLGTLQVD